jgi:hypothetical protein
MQRITDDKKILRVTQYLDIDFVPKLVTFPKNSDINYPVLELDEDIEVIFHCINCHRTVDVVDMLLVESNIRSMLAGSTLNTHGHTDIGKHEGRCTVVCPYCDKMSVGIVLWDNKEQTFVQWMHPQRAFDRVAEQLAIMDKFADELNEYEIMRLERSAMPMDVPDKE